MVQLQVIQLMLQFKMQPIKIPYLKGDVKKEEVAGIVVSAVLMTALVWFMAWFMGIRMFLIVPGATISIAGIALLVVGFIVVLWFLSLVTKEKMHWWAGLGRSVFLLCIMFLLGWWVTASYVLIFLSALIAGIVAEFTIDVWFGRD